MRALVISGGGSKGAFAGGVAEYLIQHEKCEYDLFVGSSTGSLLISHLALGEISRIKKVFTSVQQKDIFYINPFKIKELDDDNFNVSINHWNTLKSFVLRRQSFGDSKNLRKLIRESLTKDDFKLLKEQQKRIVVSVANLTKFRTEFKSNIDYSYTDFIDWIWASANYVPFMSVLNKHGHEFADGGFGSHTPIQAAIDLGAKEVDVIILETEHLERNFEPTTNPFGSLMRVFGFMTEQIYYDDLMIGKLKSKARNVTIRKFHTPYQLTDFPFVFHPKLMKKWWNEGFEHAKNHHSNSTIIPREI
ncbi:MAG: patatin-like phospholipase family protein [Flavobacteriales bacterium]|nr:patatin-like phospholipase family protein [Flavobacteriales bacterium]MCB9196248.1 patatin-like phospholipase family protein [Flavobacteriales bacterium]